MRQFSNFKSSNQTQCRITAPIIRKNEFDQSEESYGIFFYYFQQKENRKQKKSKHVSISHEIYQEIQRECEHNFLSKNKKDIYEEDSIYFFN